MKSRLLFLILSILSFSFAAEKFLIRTDWNPALSENYTVVYISQSRCFILGDAADVEKLQQAKAAVAVLERNPGIQESNSYFAVYPDQVLCPVINPEKFVLCGTVLDAVDNVLIVKGIAENIHYYSPVPVELAAITFDPVEIPEKISRTIIRKSILPENPYVKEMISKVSPDSCARLLRDLCDMFNRNPRNKQWNKGTLVPYLERKFREYGCDTVYQVAVSGYDAPAVVGIKKGKKNPSVKEFCLIGAHPDNIRTDDSNGNLRHQGAYDNGVGDVGFLEVARVLKPYDFENSIMYAGFNCEEIGLSGSKALVNQFKSSGCKVIGGAITFDMVGICQGTSSSISYSIYDGNTGGKEFSDNSKAICNTYSIPVSISTTSSSSCPSDVQNFWTNGYVAAIGRGGKGGGTYHTAADSITSIFDSTWLAKAVAPGVAIIADYAVPIGPSSIHSNKNSDASNLIKAYLSQYGHISIIITGKSNMTVKQVSIYSVSGKILKVIPLQKRNENVYYGVWNIGNGSSTVSGMYIVCGKTEKGVFQKKVMVRK